MMVEAGIISWNVHGVPIVVDRHQERLTAIARRIRALENNPDIILFQEVFTPRDSALLSHALMGRYNCVEDGPLHTLFWGAVTLRSGGLLSFISPQWRIVGHAFEMFKKGSSLWGGDALARKGFQRIDLVHRQTRLRLTVFNTHLQSGRQHSAIRRDQLEQLAHSTEHIPRSIPLLIAGDFNASTDSFLYRQLLGTYGWRDLTKDRPRSCVSQCHPLRRENQMVDYVFARLPRGWNTTASHLLICNKREDDPYSDHDGVYAHLALSRYSASSLLWAIPALSQKSSSRRQFLAIFLATLLALKDLRPELAEYFAE